MNYWRARHMGGGNIMLFETHATEEACRDFCAARKEELGTKIEYFPVCIAECDLPAKVGKS